MGVGIKREYFYDNNFINRRNNSIDIGGGQSTRVILIEKKGNDIIIWVDSLVKAKKMNDSGRVFATPIIEHLGKGRQKLTRYYTRRENGKL